MSKKSTIPPFLGQDFSAFKTFEFPGVSMGALLSSYQKNMQLMNATQRVVTETAQSLLKMHNQYAQKVMGHMNKHVKHGFSNAPLEGKASSQAEAAKATADEMINHIRATNSVITQSSEQIIESIQARFKETLSESSDFVKKGSKNPE
jgi:hypothetical protein